MLHVEFGPALAVGLAAAGQGQHHLPAGGCKARLRPGHQRQGTGWRRFGGGSGSYHATGVDSGATGEAAEERHSDLMV
jgi:hypothetical protein